MAYGRGKSTRSENLDWTRDVGDFGRRRPAWTTAERARRVALASALVLAAVAGGVWLMYLFPDTDLVLGIVIVVSWALAVAAAWWLGSVLSGAVVTIAGVLVMIVIAPVWVGYEALAIRGHTVDATVSRTDSNPDRQKIDYTDWLTGPDGRPIARPLLTYGPPPPFRAGDVIEVVVDPQGRVDSQTPDVIDNPWMPPVIVVGAVLVVAGMVIAAGEPRPRSVAVWRRGSGGQSSRPASARTRRAQRRGRGR
jgi:hypothetical protein